MTPSQTTTRIYVDADACPVKDEIYRVATRHGLPVSVVAGNFIRVPQDPLSARVAAGPGMAAADDWIAERAGKGDIAITSDIPLASRCVKAGAEVIAPNGKPFTEQSIGMTLAVRNLMTDLRSSGEVTAAPNRSRRATARRFSPRSIRPSAASSVNATNPRQTRIELNRHSTEHGASAYPVERHQAELRRHAAVVGRRTVGVVRRARMPDRAQRLGKINAAEDRR